MSKKTRGRDRRRPAVIGVVLATTWLVVRVATSLAQAVIRRRHRERAGTTP